MAVVAQWAALAMGCASTCHGRMWQHQSAARRDLRTFLAGPCVPCLGRQRRTRVIGGCDEHSCMSRNNCCTHWPSLSSPRHFTLFAPCSFFTQIHSLVLLFLFCFTPALTCRYTHNHRTLQNSGPTGCASVEWVTSVEPLTYAPHLLAAGYRAAFLAST